MRCAVDLHVHSHYAAAVSPQMTLENIVVWARRKGIDVIGTGDCLHPYWLAELERWLAPAEAGLWTPGPEFERLVAKKLPRHLQRPLRFVLSAEVSCVTMRRSKSRRVHHLLFFPSFDSVRLMQGQLARHTILEGDGRPALRLSSRELLQRLLRIDGDCHLAPAHIWNTFSSVLGAWDGGRSLEEFFGDLTPHIFAVETGLPSTPGMCRRMSVLDEFPLFATSDAHSLPNLGREYTLLDIVPSYRELFSALRSPQSARFVELVKTPLSRTHADYDQCAKCKCSFDAPRCPECGGVAIAGSRRRVEQLADRAEPTFPRFAPACRFRLPLPEVIADLGPLRPKSRGVEHRCSQLVTELGSERFILDEASFDAIAAVGAPPLARAILAQRAGLSE
jgi:ATP-dependent DNA helicase UvrD/PcrA